MAHHTVVVFDGIAHWARRMTTLYIVRCRQRPHGSGTGVVIGVVPVKIRGVDCMACLALGPFPEEL